jgi:hypothetical protein
MSCTEYELGKMHRPRSWDELTEQEQKEEREYREKHRLIDKLHEKYKLIREMCKHRGGCGWECHSEKEESKYVCYCNITEIEKLHNIEKLLKEQNDLLRKNR